MSVSQVAEYQYRINLLNEYAMTLEKQNQTKNKENTKLHQQLAILNQENYNLRSMIDRKVQSLESDIGQKLHDTLFDRSVQTDGDGTDSRVIDLKQTIQAQQQTILGYQQEGQEMFDAIQKLQNQLAERDSQLAALHQSTAVLRQQYQSLEITHHQSVAQLNSRVQLLQQQLINTQSNSRINFHVEQEMSRVIGENNELIEKVRCLQKQKNGYYQQLKKMSTLSFGQNCSRVSNMKLSGKRSPLASRWTQIENKLRQLQVENKNLENDLSIKRC